MSRAWEGISGDEPVSGDTGEPVVGDPGVSGGLLKEEVASLVGF